MATFGDTLTDDEVKQLVAKHGRDKVVALMDLDEHATDEQIKSLMGGSGAPPSPQSPEMSTGDALVANTPLLPDAIALAQGKYTEGGAADTAGRVAGDVGQAAGLAAPFAAMGTAAMAPVAAGVGLGALTGAALEKTGVSPYLRTEANKVRAQVPAVEPFVESDNPVIKALQYAKSIGFQVPNEAKATAIDLAPTALAMLGSGAALKGINALQSKPNLGKAPGAAGLLQEYGGKITPAMEQYAQKGQRSGMAPAIENLGRANPLTSGMLERTDKANVGAIKDYTAKTLPENLNVGQNLTDTFENFQKTRGGAVEKAKNASRGLSVEGSNPGQIASKNIIDKLQAAGVPVDEKGFRPDLMTGKESMSKSTAEALVEVERNLKGASIPEALNFLQNFDNDFAPVLRQKYGYSSDMPIKEARGIIRDSIDQAVSSASPDIAGQVKEANRVYSTSQPTVRSALEKIRGDVPTTELFNRIFGKSAAHADKGLGRLSRTMPADQFSNIQDSMAAALIQSSQTTGGDLSLKMLKTNLKNMDGNARYLKPEHSTAINNLIQMMETAGVAELGQPNPSGTGSRAVANTLLGGTGASALLGHPGPLAAAVGGSGASALYLKGPQIKAALGKGINNLPNVPVGKAAAVSGLGPSLSSKEAADKARRLSQVGK